MDAFSWIFGLLIPAVMVVTGLLMWKKPPKEINYVVGYRTSLSTKSKATWKFAHLHAGKLWVRIGIVSMAASALALAFIPAPGEDILIALNIIQLAVLILSIFPTQLSLKRNFDKFGNPRS